MLDLLLTTKSQSGVDPTVPLVGSPSQYFGEASNDIQLDTLSDLAQVTGLTKLQQDILKIVLTELGANPLFPVYGTDIRTLIGKNVSLEYAQAKIHDQVSNALQLLAFLNQDNPNLDEKPQTLQSMTVEQLALDVISAEIVVITESGKSLSTSFTITG